MAESRNDPIQLSPVNEAAEVGDDIVLDTGERGVVTGQPDDDVAALLGRTQQNAVGRCLSTAPTISSISSASMRAVSS